MVLNNLVDYTSSMSLDPAVVSKAIAGVGTGIGNALSGAGEAVGHVITGISQGVGDFCSNLLKGPLQLIINVVCILAASAAVLFAVYKVCTTKAIRQKILCRREKEKESEDIEMNMHRDIGRDQDKESESVSEVKKPSHAVVQKDPSSEWCFYEEALARRPYLHRQCMGPLS